MNTDYRLLLLWTLITGGGLTVIWGPTPHKRLQRPSSVRHRQSAPIINQMTRSHDPFSWQTNKERNVKWSPRASTRPWTRTFYSDNPRGRGAVGEIGSSQSPLDDNCDDDGNDWDANIAYSHLRVGVSIVGLQSKAVNLPKNHPERPDVRLGGELAVQDRLWNVFAKKRLWK